MHHKPRARPLEHVPERIGDVVADVVILGLPPSLSGNSERGSNVVGGQTGRMDSQRAAGQGDAKAHSKTHRAPYGRTQAP